MTNPPYFKQEYKYACSIAVLRIVLANYGIFVTETELIKKVEKEYGKNFQNLWNPTLAKMGREYGIDTTMYATWSLLKKNPNILKNKEFKNPRYEDGTVILLTLEQKEFFKALKLGSAYIHGKLTTQRIKTLLSKNYLIQTSVRLHLLYPGERQIFHSILIYKLVGDTVYFHDPARSESMSSHIATLVKAANNAGVVIVYKGLEK